VKKYAISGTSCSGKTTLINALKNSDHTIDIAYVDEAGRKFFSENPMTEIERFLPITQERISNLIISMETDAMKNSPDLVICDNSVVAAAVYAGVLNGRHEADRIMDLNSDWLKTYHKFFVLNPDDVEFKNDDVRSESLEFRNQAHQLFIETYKRYGLDFEIVSGNVQQRLDFIETQIGL
jgi:predicted ATPase